MLTNQQLFTTMQLSQIEKFAFKVMKKDQKCICHSLPYIVCFSEIWSHGAPPEGDGLYIAMIVVLSLGNKIYCFLSLLLLSVNNLNKLQLQIK